MALLGAPQGVGSKWPRDTSKNLDYGGIVFGLFPVTEPFGTSRTLFLFKNPRPTLENHQNNAFLLGKVRAIVPPKFNHLRK